MNESGGNDDAGSEVLGGEEDVEEQRFGHESRGNQREKDSDGRRDENDAAKKALQSQLGVEEKKRKEGLLRRNPQDGENVKTEIIVSEVYPVTLATAVSMSVASVDDAGRASGALLAAAASALANPYIVGQLAE